VVFPEGAELPAPSPTEPPADEDFPLRGEKSEEGAIDAAKYYWQLNIYGRASGASSEMKSMTSAECGTCANLISVHETAANGGYYSMSDYAELSQVAVRKKSDDNYIVNFNASHAIYHMTNPRDRTVDGFSSNGIVGLELVWRDGAWLVTAGAVDGGEGVE
jgi:hypothetical protein